MEFGIRQGDIVLYEDMKYRIKSPLSLERVLMESVDTGESISANLSDLRPVAINEQRPNTICVASVSSDVWAEAKKREEAIKEFVSCVCSRQDAENIGEKLGITGRQVYKLIQRYQKSGCKLNALLPVQSDGGSGKSRINNEIEQIIQVTIDELYLTRQKYKVSIVVEEILRRCHYANLKRPSERTIRRRIHNIAAKLVVAKREGAKVARNKYSPIFGEFPEVTSPLKVVQIDHTPVDVIIVDEFHRKPIGRPYLTIAIDVFSRCITGFCLSLEPPSAVSVGLCLTHSVFDKDAWLVDRNIVGAWSIWGKPSVIYVDNAKEFHSEALQRGCDINGIRIEYRPLAQPQYGGIVERVIGTMMQLVHQLPGTTFSNIAERGDYSSEKNAALTLAELERWLTVAITEYYHQKIHSGLNMPPIAKYTEGILGDEHHNGCGYPPRIHNKRGFLIDFLPIERRTMQRHGFMLDHISYYSNALSPMIANRKKHEQFIVRRDPRDISCIYVLDKRSNEYLEIPYRTLSRPTITLWEHRQALKYLREKGLKQQDENLIFQAVEKLRVITNGAVANSKQARRQHERAKNISSVMQKEEPAQENNEPMISQADDYQPAKRFEDIEIW